MISFAAEPLFHIGPITITNSVINTVFVDALLFGTVFYVKNHLQKVPGKFQAMIELVIESFYNMTEEISGKNAVKIFPYFATFFFFILVSNWSGLLPLSSIGFFHTVDGKKELVPLMRNATSDVNVTFALALISVIATHMLAIKALGIKEYLKKFFSLNPILLFVGMLEIISEGTKVVSLSFRLFGNIFAGETVLTTVSGIFAFLFPLPFLMLEVIVGIVQALVFAMLTMVFMSILMTSHHSNEHEEAKEVSRT